TGNLTYAASGDPLGAVVNAVLAYNGTTTGSRTITAASSLGADVELTFNKTITATAFASDQRLVFGGTGDITLNAATSVAGSGSDLQKNGTGILNINAETAAADDWVIDAGITNANVSNALNAADDIVIDGTGVQDSAVVNIGGTAGVSGVHQGDDIFIRNGGRINVTVNNGINTGTDYLLVGDTLSASTAAAARLHLAADISTGAAGLQVGGASGNIGNITGNGSITSAGSFSLRNGSVAAGITLAGTGSITKVTNGTLVFSGESTASGTTNVQEGTLVLDYTFNNGSKIGGALALGAVQPNLSGGGPTLVINGNAGAATLQTATGTSILLGASHVEINAAAGREATFSLGALTRTTGGGTVDFVYSDINAVATAAPGSAVLGWATVRIGSGPVRMAAVNSSGRIEQVATVAKASLATWNAEDHILVTGGLSGSVGVTSRAVSTLNFAAASATTVTVEANRQFTIGSGGILVDAGVGANKSLISGGQLAGSLSGVLNELIVHQHNAAGDFEIASRLFNLSTITKSGTGTLVLSANNFFSSSLSNATASASTLVLNEGRVVFRGGNALGDATSVSMKQGTTLALEANSVETIGRLGVDGTNPSAGTISLGTGSALTISQTGSATFAGVFEGSGTLNKTGTGNLQLTGNITTGFTGVVNVNAGMLYISGSSARLSGVTAFNLNAGTSFLIDNDDDNSNLTRLADDSVFTLNSANGAWSGETRPRGLSVRTDNSSTTSFVETIGSLVLASGANYATLEASGGASSVAGIIAANAITRTAGTTFNIRGAGLGAVSGQRTVLKIADASDAAFMAANLVGGGAATGGSNKNISIVPWAIGETIADDLVDANMGNSFVTYVDNRGFVVLDLSTEFRTFAAGGTSQDNIREVLSANLTGLVGPTINSLILHDSTTAAGSLVVSGTGTLTNTSGAFLFTLNPAATASSLHSVKVEGFSAIRVGASSEYIMHVVNPTSTTTTPVLAVEIASNLDTVAASLSKSGRGTLILSGTNTYGGGTYLNEGVVQIKNLGNLGTGGLTFNGGTLQLAASFAGELGSRSIVVSNAGGTLDTNGQNYVWENGLDMTGTGSFAKGGGGLLTVQGASSFGGTFIVNHHSATTGALAGVSQGVLLNGATNLTVNGNLQIGSSGTPSSGIAGAALGGDEQILDTASITFNGLASSSRWAYFKLLGHTETVAGISDVTGAGVLENRESDVVTSAGTLVLNSSSDFSYNGYLRDNAANSVDANPLNLVKQGSGMQVLSGNQIRYTGTTMVSGGTLYLLNTNLFASAVVNNATVVFDYSPATALTLTKSLSGTGTYVKRGTGT
ncbi:MAG: beta strand repeat-containing protein, partial [Verrucomicrobium sp.]